MFDLVAPSRLLLAFTVGFFSLATATNGAAGLKSRAVGKVPKRATDNDMRYQPALGETRIDPDLNQHSLAHLFACLQILTQTPVITWRP